MTTDRDELRSCDPLQRDCATGPAECATPRATAAQPGSLKAAAALVLQRNRARNQSATETAQPRNRDCATEPPAVARTADPVTAADALEGFARPLPPASLPPLARLAAALGDEPDDLREFLDRTGPGRALRARIEREAGAVDRCLLALRADPGGGLLPVLLRALDAATRTRGRGLTGRGP